MEKITKKPLKDSEPMVKRNEKGQLLPGSVLNPDGYVKGTRNFNTDFDEVVEEIAKANNITPSEARKILLRTAYKEAKDGKYPFYKDIQDRVYGQATNKTEHSGQVVLIDGITKEEIEALKALI